MAKDAVIGFITGYKFDKLKPWIKSLEESGFEGDKILVCYDISNNVIDEIGRHGISVYKIPVPQPFNIVVHRFYHLWHILNNRNQKYGWVITTDVADVIFQTNPSEWLENNTEFCDGIIASGEGLLYKDEPWGINNMRLSFGPDIAKKMSDWPICNAGVIAGSHEQLSDLALNVFLSCQGSPLHVPGGGGPDQASYNLTLSLSPWFEITQFTTHDDGWACQCGTTVDPNKINDFRPHILDCEPNWDGEYALTPEGKKYCVVHQYNRVPEWKEVIEKRYDR